MDHLFQFLFKTTTAFQLVRLNRVPLCSISVHNCCPLVCWFSIATKTENPNTGFVCFDAWRRYVRRGSAAPPGRVIRLRAFRQVSAAGGRVSSCRAGSRNGSPRRPPWVNLLPRRCDGEASRGARVQVAGWRRWGVEEGVGGGLNPLTERPGGGRGAA